MKKNIKLSREVVISDPCYTDDVECKFLLTNVLPGNYFVKVTYYEDKDWGRRVASLAVYHNKLKEIFPPASFEPFYDGYGGMNWEEYGELGVDSAQAGIFCKTTYRNDEYAETLPTFTGMLNMDLLPSIESGDVFYKKMCGFSVNTKDFYHTYERGVVSRSGYGDGGYPLFVAYDENKNIVAMKIIYIFPEKSDNIYVSNLSDYTD